MPAAQRRACAAGGCPHGIRPFCCRLWPPRWSIREVVLLGRRLFFMPLIHQWAKQAGYAGAGAYLMVGMVGWNFLLETAVNMALTPMLAQLIRLGSRRCL